MSPFFQSIGAMGCVWGGGGWSGEGGHHGWGCGATSRPEAIQAYSAVQFSTPSVPRSASSAAAGQRAPWERLPGCAAPLALPAGERARGATTAAKQPSRVPGAPLLLQSAGRVCPGRCCCKAAGRPAGLLTAAPTLVGVLVGGVVAGARVGHLGRDGAGRERWWRQGPEWTRGLRARRAG